MSNLMIDRILDQIPYDFFTDAEISLVLRDKTDASRYNLIKRALEKKELFQIRRGLYQLAQRYQRQKINPYELAQKIYGPSYVSFESSLSYFGLIPEAVPSLSSASSKRARKFNTIHGLFAYSQVPLRAFAEGVDRINQDGHIFLIATPLKALADYVYCNRVNWTGIVPLIESLRMEKRNLKFKKSEVDEIIKAYQTPRVTNFLEGLKKDLKL